MPTIHHRFRYAMVDTLRSAHPTKIIEWRTNFALLLLAALIVAAVPGPGIFSSRHAHSPAASESGFASTFGTALGGLVHVIGGALGVSAIILASAELFTVLKFAGALYLVWLGIKTFREAGGLRATNCRHGRDAPGVSRRGAGRSLEPEDRRVLPRLHSAIRRSGE